MEIIDPAFITALSPILVGVVATIVGYCKPTPATTPPWQAALVKALRWLGPLVIALGLGHMYYDRNTREEAAKDVARLIRQERPLPAQIDETTRLEAVDARKDRVVFLMRVTNRASTKLSANYLVPVVRPGLLKSICENKQYVEFLDRDVVFEYIYTVNQQASPPIVITREDCAR